MSHDTDVQSRHRMEVVVNRKEFQELANIRLTQAIALLNLRKWDGAYYLAGYAVDAP